MKAPSEETRLAPAQKMADRSAMGMGIGCRARRESAIGGLGWLALLLVSFSPARAELSYFGVNLTGAEYGTNAYPGTYNTDYTYPTFSEVGYFMSKGMNTFRVPFAWERMQPTASGPLDTVGIQSQISLMDTFVNYATAQGASVILDPHNFGAYYGEVIGAQNSSVTAANFANLWSQLATHYKSNDRVIFNLMNEPVGLNDAARPGGTTEAWLGSANAAIGAIRNAGASNLILVPGNGYTGAASWSQTYYGTSNADTMGGVYDPENHFAYEVHLYLDANASGQYLDGMGQPTSVVSPTIGSERLVDFTNWLRANNAQGFLGEFGVPSDAMSLAAMDDMLNFVDANADVWSGWTYWAAGPWNQDFLSIEPDGNGDKPQLAILEDHIAAVPEPGTVWLMAAGLSLVALCGTTRRRALAVTDDAT
jgi:endoglucanase